MTIPEITPAALERARKKRFPLEEFTRTQPFFVDAICELKKPTQEQRVAMLVGASLMYQAIEESDQDEHVLVFDEPTSVQ